MTTPRRRTAAVGKRHEVDADSQSETSGIDELTTHKDTTGTLQSHSHLGNGTTTSHSPSLSKSTKSSHAPGAKQGEDNADSDEHQLPNENGHSPHANRPSELLHHYLDPAQQAIAALPHKAYDKVEEIAHYLDPAQQAIAALPHKAYDKVEEIAHKVKEWTVMHFHQLPHWLKDNEFLIKGHRPELNSFIECFKSMFRIHTETGNIWTHLIGFVAFVIMAVYYMLTQEMKMTFLERLSIFVFFLGAISCLGFSWVFHTVYCHSENVGKLFCKLDYCGIAMLTVGSFVPWLHFTFYCQLCTKITYMIFVVLLGGICIYISMSDKFSTSAYRALRAAMYVGLGLSGAIPVMHYVITEGLSNAINFAALGQLMIMAALYIGGAVIYALRVPERLWPGKFDIWFQSHQIFHVFVIAAAFVHYHGISELASNRLNLLDCMDS